MSADFENQRQNNAMRNRSANGGDIGISKYNTTGTGAVAGIIAYVPDITIVRNLIASISDEVQSVVIIDNSPKSILADLGLPRDETKIYYEAHPENVGLGAAYCRIAEIAAARGASEIVLFDQDSSPRPGMVSSLRKVMSELQQAGARPAVVGPRPVAADPSATQNKTPTLYPRRADVGSDIAQSVWFVISSGSVVSLPALREIGDFEVDFFIDAIDVEWCMRAWSRGYSCWIARDVEMPHRLGIGVQRVGRRHWAFALQPAWRLATYARNQATLLRRSYVPWRWKLRWLAYFVTQVVVYLIVDRGRTERVRGLLSGFWAGIRGRIGPPRIPPR